MLDNLQWPTLQDRRRKTKVTMLYRIVHHLVAIPTSTYLVPRGANLPTRGHDIRFLLTYSRIQSHQQSFFPATIRLWNDLPSAAVNATTLDGFKDSIKTISMT